jgi:TolB-like protein/Tfp pilus assembly protein PilF
VSTAARSDLYSLGVLLYEVLSGGRPYRLKSAASIGLLDQAIETVEVKKPSQQIDPAAANSRACTADRLAGQLRGDLDTIVLKALAKEPAQRYPSAAALAEDLHRHLDGKPIGARPARVVYRLRKFVLRNRAPLGVAVAALAAILAAVGYGLYRESRAQVSVSARALVRPVAPSPASAVAAFAPPAHSIAVLPFTDLSEKHDQEYFADGIAEEIIDRLVKLPELRVPARASSFYFKGRPTKVSEIARDLSVANVLEGSVRTSANRLRVTVQLVRADTGYQVWSESYDRQLQDVFKVQDEIATAVAGALQVSLMGGPLTQEIGGTHSFKAYQLYLQARRDLFDFTATSLKHGEAVLQQAVTIDPHFGLAWSLMALISANEADISVVSRPKGYGGGLRLAMHAIKVSPGLAAPHATLAYVYTIYDWDWPAAAEEVHRALDINPRDEWALESAGVLARTLGHWDEAVSYHRALVAQDPLSTIGYLDLGNTLYLAGRYPESEAAYRRGLDIDPNVSVLKKFFAKTLLAEGKPAAALETLESIEPGPFKLQYLPAVLLANGRKADADAVLQELISKYPDSFTYSIAMNLAYRNEKDLSLQWLERAYALKDDALIELVGEPLYRNLAADQRFKAFLRKMNLPD